MEQGRRDDDANQNTNQQPKRSKVIEYPVPPNNQPPPPQKCPRCESLNTKFCYYNNYNHAQPRYFCKACRRYWTHGGTLRNVPVGGGCRKGRRGKVSPGSGGESSRSQPSQQPPPRVLQPSQQSQAQFPTVNKMAAMVSGTSSWGHIPITGNSSYPGGIFAAFEGIQMPSLTMSQTQGLINRPLRIGDGIGGAGTGANMPVFRGFDFSSMKSQHAQSQPQQIVRGQPSQFDGMGNLNKEKQPMFPPDANLFLPAGYLNSWAPSSTSSGMPESSFNPNEWPNLPDYDAPK